MARRPEGWEKRAKAWYEDALGLRELAREMRLDLAENLLQARDEEYYKAGGYDRFEDFCREFYGLSTAMAYQYISIAENVQKALPEDLAKRLTSGDNPLSLKLLAALHFDHISPQEMERIRKLDAGQQKVELVRLGYDREKMGGRAASDLLRSQIGKRKYRDQSGKIQVRDEQIRMKEGENAELKEQLRAEREQKEQILAAIQDPNSAKLLKTLDYLTTEVAKLKKAEAEAEAEIAVGREVGTRALILSGEIQALLSRFEDSVRIDNSKQWTEVWRIIDSILDAVGDCRGRMAGVILARIEDGEITRFAVEEPGEEVRTAEQAMRPRAK